MEELGFRYTETKQVFWQLDQSALTFDQQIKNIKDEVLKTTFLRPIVERNDLTDEDEIEIETHYQEFLKKGGEQDPQ